MPRKKNWKKSSAKTVVRADGGSPGLHISDVGLTHLLDHGGSKLHSPVAMGTSEPGSHILSDVGMTCPSVSSDPGSTNISDVGMTCLIVTFDAMKTQVAPAQSSNDIETHVASAQSTTNIKTHVASAQSTSDKYVHRKQPVQTAKVLQSANDKNMKTHVSTVLQTTNDKDVNRKQVVQEINIHSPIEVTNAVFPNSTQVVEKAMYTAFPLTEQTETMLWKPSNGPFNSVKFELGSFHQGSEIFSNESRGCQCTANALCSLIFAAYSDISCNTDLDNILLAGDCLYNKIIYELKAKGQFRSKLLSFDELPRLVSILNKDVVVKTSAIVTGLCTEQFVNTSLPTLHQALYTALQSSTGVLLMMGSICSSVFKRDCKYFIFDSHSHGFNGLSVPDGRSLLAGFNCLDDLVLFLYALFESMMISISTQFEILPVDFDLSDLEHNSVFPTNCQTDTPCDYDWKTVTYKRNWAESHIRNAHAREDFFVHSDGENHATLIGKYFKDQKHRLEEKTCNSTKVTKNKKKRNKEIKMNKKKVTERKEYMKVYMQKRRQDSSFKVKDKKYTLKSMQSARQSEEYRKKDREFNLKSMQSARQSEDYRKKDREYTVKCRQSEEYRKKDREYTGKSMQSARQSEEYRKKDREYTVKSMQSARQSQEYRKKDREYTGKSMQSARQSEEYRKKDREYTVKSMQSARQSEEYRKKDREYTVKSMQSARQSEEYRKKDREFNLKSMQRARQSEEYRKKDREYTIKSMQSARQSEEYRKKDREFNLKSMQSARQSEECRIKDKDRTKACMRRARLIDEHKKWESETKKESRKCPEFKQKDIEIQNRSRRKARSDPYILEQERVAKQQWRLNERNKKAENIKDCRRKATKRKDPSFSQTEKLTAKHRKFGSDIDVCIERFHKNISVGPLYVCSCCHQTWFEDTVSKVKTFACKDKEKYLTGVKSVNEEEWICCTCKANIKCGKVPKLSVFNGMKWPPKPKELELFPLEERLIALRIPFMQMRELPRGRQLSVKGNVVNVPVDIQPVVNALPRPFDENVTVAVKLKKKMSFKSYVFSENVRPFHVLSALHWLMSGSELYKNANVEIDQQWIKKITEESTETLHAFLESQQTAHSETNNVEFDGALDECLQDVPHGENQAEIIHKFFKWCTKECSKYNIVDFDSVVSEMCDSCSNNQIGDISNDNTSHVEELYDSDAEEITQENVGNIDTLLDDADIENRNSTFTFAPGEGQRPLSIFQDKDSEYLCFPTIFCGQRRTDNDDRIVPVHYSDIVKWELRSQDRRAANSVPNIFFKLKKIQMKQLNDKANLAVRRCQTGTNTITAEQARNSESIDSIVKNDEGYYLFKQLRNSPAYLESRKKDVYAMIRQLGLPTWFMSLSSADTRWIDLLKMLAILNKKYTEYQIENLTWEQKIKLIQSDPVTCSRYFEHRVKEFINSVLKSEHEPLGKVVDYFFRVEFQQRGSPHIHMIVWVQNAPKFNVDSDAELAAYVDQYLKCSIDNPQLRSLIELQIHKHSRTCRKREDKICRFGYPLPPLSKTMVLQPLETEKDKYYKLYQNIQKTMNNKKDGYDMSYEEFLTDVVQMSEQEYIKCIRSSLNSSKVFLKRNPGEIRVNLYNDSVLKAWKANIDIQFVLDPYACAMYIVSYISKSQRGMSNLLHAAAKEARNGNMDLKRQVRHIGNVFSNSVEVSAQEAVYLVLQMPLTKSSRSVVFINTSLPNQRVQLLKPKSVLDELPADSTDIMSDNKVKRYSKRPKLLETYCLADYVSELEVIYPDCQNNNSDEEEQDYEKDTELSDEESFGDDETILTLKNGIKIKRCRNSKIIRYVRFNRKTDEENYYREKLLLFHPWRKEETDLLGTFRTYKEHYESIKHVIDHKSSTYEHHAEELELARDLAEMEHDAFDAIAPSTQQAEGDDAEMEPIQSEEFIYFNPDRIEHRDYDIGTEIGCYVSAPQIDVNENILSDIDYRKLLQCLNSKQKQFYYHVIHWIKTKDAPLYAFLSGGAGVGKSLVIRALYQTLFRILNLKEGEDADHSRVLLCAFTGKAAFNINGSTISSAFKQKYKQSDQTLTCDSLNTFRSKYRDLSVVIIDEISMVSNSMLNFIDQRLQALKGTRTPFGGVSIIAVGDLYQLKPVSGDWIFNDMKHDAAA